MVHLIDKDDLVSEIEKRQKEEVSYNEDGSFASWADQNHYYTLESIKEIINSLEVKEVDLEKEYERYYEQERNIHQTFRLAKHFFEFGLNAQKE